MIERTGTTDHLIAAANQTQQHHGISGVIVVLAALVLLGTACMLRRIYWWLQRWAYYAQWRAAIAFHELTQIAGIAIILGVGSAVVYYAFLA